MNIAELKTGDMIAFKKGKHPLSRLVHFFTKSDVNHVAMVMMLYNRIGTPFPCIVEANEKGVQIHYLPNVIEKTKDKLYCYKLSAENLNKINIKMDNFYKFTFEQNDKPYSCKDAILSVLDKVNDRLVVKDDYQDFDCSILVAAIYYEFGVVNKEILKSMNFNYFHELTPIDTCNLPIFTGEPFLIN